ncbi:YbbR-like domain-containing protein [bacterium]|nr:YbbR-like domain-containing protein [bacterium]
MLKKIFGNLPAKLVSLLIAILIWFHVVTEQSYEYSIDCFLTLVNIPQEYILLSPLPEKVTVRFFGRGKELIKMLFREPSVFIDAGGFRYGTRNYEILPRDVQLGERELSVREIIYPKIISVDLDKYGTVRIPIVSNLEIIASPGYILSKPPVFDPGEVILQGPLQHITHVEYISTVAETLRNLNKSITRLVEFDIDDTLLSVIPAKTTVIVEVEPSFSKKFEGLPVKLINVPKGIKAKLLIKEIDVEVTGTQGAIDSLVSSQIEVYVDFNQVPELGPERLPPLIETLPGLIPKPLKPQYFEVKIGS